MTIQTQNGLTQDKFLAWLQDDITNEWVDGKAQAKISPKYFHSSQTDFLLMRLHSWSHRLLRLTATRGLSAAVIVGQNRGRVGIKGSVFYPDTSPEIKRGTALIINSIFEGLELTAS